MQINGARTGSTRATDSELAASAKPAKVNRCRQPLVGQLKPASLRALAVGMLLWALVCPAELLDNCSSPASGRPRGDRRRRQAELGSAQGESDDDDDDDLEASEIGVGASSPEPDHSALDGGDAEEEGEDGDDDDDDEEFYQQHPLDSQAPAGRQATDYIRDIQVSDADFRDFRDFDDRPVEPQASGTSGGSAQVQTGRPVVGGADCVLALKRGTCISLHQVEWALARARHRLGFRRPRDLNARQPSEASINAVGELVELTSRLLTDAFQLDAEEVFAGLEQVDVRRTSLWADCPAKYRRPSECSRSPAALSPYRSHSGRCNNPYAGELGASGMPFVRMLPPEYADAIGAPRGSLARPLAEPPSGRVPTGSRLPPARLLALALHPDLQIYAGDLSAMFANWGQLINHDLAEAAGARAASGHSGSCCSRRAGADSAGRVCMPIEIDARDPLYGRLGVRCHEFKRSLSALRPGCTLGPRTQLNLISAYLDGSFVYGSSGDASGALRARTGGLLRMRALFARQNLLPLLPAQLESPDEECVARPPGRHCFRSGDSRTNQQVPLVVLHTLHARQHNRLARALGRLNPHWRDERLYQEARRIHVALLQHLLLSEYLPALLGAQLMSEHKLTESAPGQYWDHYEPALNPGISQAFAGAAFRMGHSTVPPLVYRHSSGHQPLRAYALRQLYRQPWALYEPLALDQFALGLLDTPSGAPDPFVASELSGHLLQTPGQTVGLDLSAINIQRGRDQGIAGYNAFREWCGLARVEAFEELDSVMSNRSSHTMASLYAHPDDIDLFTGGLSEYPLEGAQLGPTFACIIGRQFGNLRAADRFWYESPAAFSPGQLDSIKQVSLARLLCANSDSIVTIQARALQLAHPVLNPRLPCSSLADLDLALWFEPANLSAPAPVLPLD